MFKLKLTVEGAKFLETKYDNVLIFHFKNNHEIVDITFSTHLVMPWYIPGLLTSARLIKYFHA